MRTGAGPKTGPGSEEGGGGPGLPAAAPQGEGPDDEQARHGQDESEARARVGQQPAQGVDGGGGGDRDGHGRGDDGARLRGHAIVTDTDTAIGAESVILRIDQELRSRGAVDFDDLMIVPLQVLAGDEEVRRRERERIRWLLVDEYQDVNRPQYLLLRYLTGPECRLNVVGDPDQSIYGWRGADIGMILNFERDFTGGEGQKEARTIILDEDRKSNV